MNKLIYILIYTKQIQIFRLHIEIFLMVVCLLECSGLIPDIDLQGTEYMNNGVVIFQFNCSSNIGFKGCTVEGILGNRTHDNIRYAHDECFHKDGKCTLECCECSSDCKFFIWNVTILNKTVNNSFGCQSRIESNSITYKAMVFIRHNSNGFTVSNKTVDPIKGYKPIITIRPSISDVPCGSKIVKKIEEKYNCWQKPMVWAIIGLAPIVLICCVCARQNVCSDKISRWKQKASSNQQCVAASQIFGVVLVIIVFVIPLAVGYQERICNDRIAALFAIFGLVCAILVMCCYIIQKDNMNKEYSDVSVEMITDEQE